ncbi:HtaA domain-containing protein [Streptomyces poonensis]|uniref:Htaa domain-containing protein n=1 Tax=Streptomyces poonensis TaxID=68255 RepID=A0A918QBT1_9ACTN|nr:HtaA domain-containing protein [Streptomyces poonensis]GGZ41204.1 hypothetical protein GCM10010365_72370 [Streptomyces poonensis]GLJ91768.1 hypothetical protein GCM10017589_43750 [Streptomyces poonensis]
MRKRPVAALAGGVLIALLCQAPAQAAEDGARAPYEVSGGYASWSGPAGGGADVTVRAEEPAVGGAGGRSWLPVTGGSATPTAGDADVGLAGALRLSVAGAEGGDLVLDELRLRLDGGTGTLYVRAEQAGGARRLALADVGSGPSAPVVRSAGATWTGLRTTLTAAGAELLSSWSGKAYAEGGELAPLDVTVGVPAQAGDGRSPASPSAPEQEEGQGQAPEPVPGATSGPGAGPRGAAEDEEAPSAGVARPSLAPGGEQLVTGAGFEPGEVVLVAIDGDTRYDVVADGSGRVSQAFPVYATAVEGEHAVALDSVSGGRSAAVEFAVRHG